MSSGRLRNAAPRAGKAAKDTRELRRLLLKRLRLDSPEQKDAEDHLVNILEQSFQARSPQWTTRDVAGREVDWTETYRRALTSQPTRFVSREIDRKPDKELMGALRYQARQWLDILDASSTPDHEQRAEKLRQALVQNPGPEGQPAVPMTKPLLQRLRQKGPKARKTSDALARVFTHQHTTPDEIVSIVEQAIESAEGWWNDESAAKNTVWNRLLELGVLLAITQTAVQSEWNLRDHPDLQDTFKVILEHPTAPMTLTVGKEAPGTDVFTNMREPAGLADGIDPQDSQPDVCLTFCHTETGESISVLGDAKRNATEDGTGYFRDGLRTATYYLSAFAGSLQADFVPPDTWGSDSDGARIPSGAIRPTVTLFFRQEADPWVFQAEEQTLGADSSPPPILACNIEDHFGLHDSSMEEWHSIFLNRWLAHISKRTCEHLC